MATGQHGGYRRPDKPAAVSGPGKFSQRTDGGPDQPQRYLQGDGSYGDSKSLNEVAAGAPLAQAPQPSAPPVNVVPLGAPTDRPDEPVTAGAPFGPGPNEVTLPLSLTPTPQEIARDIRVAYVADPNPQTLRLLEMIEAQGL